MGRAERRRKEKAARKEHPPLADEGPIYDLVIRHYAPATVEELLACAASFPTERRTVTICGTLPLDATPEIPGLRGKPISGTAAEHLNQGASRGSAPYIAFVDSECRLKEPDMLDLALAHLTKGAAIVSPLIVNGDKVYAAGYAFGITRPYHRYRGWSADHERVHRPMQIQAGPLTCMFTHRAAFRRTQGFLQPFGARPFAEVGYGLHLRSLGAPIIYEPAIQVDTPGAMEPAPEAYRQARELLMQLGRPVYDEWSLL
jgi:hypothetical protein